MLHSCNVGVKHQNILYTVSCKISNGCCHSCRRGTVFSPFCIPVLSSQGLYCSLSQGEVPDFFIFYVSLTLNSVDILIQIPVDLSFRNSFCRTKKYWFVSFAKRMQNQQNTSCFASHPKFSPPTQNKPGYCILDILSIYSSKLLLFCALYNKPVSILVVYPAKLQSLSI